MYISRTPVLFLLVAALIGFISAVPAHAAYGGRVIMVSPDDDPDPLAKAEADWNNINDALQEAGPGDIVILSAGLFYLHRPVVRRDFDGTLKGMGKDKTTVQTAPGVLFDLSGNPTYSFVDGFTFRDNHMFSFPHQLNSEERSVTVSDMRLVCDQPATPWSRGYPGSLEEDLNAVGGIIVFNETLPTEDFIDVDVNLLRLAVEGVEDPSFRSPSGTNYSCATGLATLGVARGHVTVHQSEVRNAVVGAQLHGWVGDGSSVTVSHGVFENNLVALFSDGWARYLATHNEIINSQRVGILLGNDPTYLPAGFTATRGQVLLNTLRGGRVFGILLGAGVEKVSVEKNVLDGLTTVGGAAGGSGITAPIVTVAGSNSTISKNTFRNIQGGVGPDIRLFFSSHISVLGNDHRDSGQPGWTGDPLGGICTDGPGAIMVQGGNDNMLADRKFPDAASVATMVCDQGTDTIIDVAGGGASKVSGLADALALSQNYPNPFNPTTTIAFDLPERGTVRLQVFDLLGRVVAEPASGEYPPGRTEVTWDATDLASGVYIYRLEAGGRALTKRLLLLK